MSTSLRQLVEVVRLPGTRRWQVPANALDNPSEVVVFVPPDGDVARGWELVDAQLLTTHSPVLLVARGVTHDGLAAHRAASGRVRAAELDGYLPSDKTPVLEHLSEPVREWLRQYFQGALSEVPVEEAFWSSAMMRVLRAPVAALPLALGLAKRHGAQTILLSEAWVGELALEQVVNMLGGRLDRAFRGGLAVPFSVSFLAHWAAFLGTSVATRSFEFARQTKARKALRELRTSFRGATPKLWITVTGHWPHSCRHVIESVARSASQNSVPLGVLLQYALEPGLVSGGMRERAEEQTDLFPALKHPDVLPALAAVDQIASAESWGELANVLLRSSISSTRLAARLLRTGPRHKVGHLPLDARTHVQDLARLITIDLLRAEEARSATRRVLRTHRFAGSTIAFSHASLAPVCVPDLLFQAAGATTFDVVHGALAEALDMVTFARTFSTHKVFWTREEARYTEKLMGPQRCVGGFPSRDLRGHVRPPADAARPLRVLALTNYATRVGDRLVRLPRIVWQHHFFDALHALRDVGVPCELRWRPHPGDAADAIDSTIASHAALGIARSRGSHLDEDLAWADLVVTSVSSVIVEALAHEVAVFVHDVPIHEADIILSIFEAGRLFHDRESLGTGIRAYLAARRLRNGDVLGAERRLTSRFFGHGGLARSAGALILDSSLVSAMVPS